MFSLTQTKKIIITFSLFFLAGSVYLLSIDSRYTNPSYNQGWFSLSFIQSKDGSLDFNIENFTQVSDFYWEIFKEDGQRISDGFAQVPPQTKKEVFVSLDSDIKGKVTIRVSSSQETREIYKNIK